MSTIQITSKIRIPEREIHFSYARSSGPGGQHVNKSNTKVTLIWSLKDSQSLALDTMDYLTLRLANQLTSDGRLIVSSDRYRSQARNREDCLQKFSELIAKAASVPKKRKKTKPTKGSKQRRLKDKKSRSETKQLRKRVL